MTYDRPPTHLPATPDYVLAVSRDSYRQQCQFDPDAEPDVELTFQTTIAEWRSSYNLLEWRQLGRALRNQWKLGRPDTAWHAVGPLPMRPELPSQGGRETELHVLSASWLAGLRRRGQRKDEGKKRGREP